MVETTKLAATRSWRTTLMGVGGALVAVIPQILRLVDDDPATACDWPVVIAAVFVALGLGAARDNGVTSEQAGAAPPR